jgi:hypothetical protein
MSGLEREAHRASVHQDLVPDLGGVGSREPDGVNAGAVVPAASLAAALFEQWSEFLGVLEVVVQI